MSDAVELVQQTIQEEEARIAQVKELWDIINTWSTSDPSRTLQCVSEAKKKTNQASDCIVDMCKRQMSKVELANSVTTFDRLIRSAQVALHCAYMTALAVQEDRMERMKRILTTAIDNDVPKNPSHHNNFPDKRTKAPIHTKRTFTMLTELADYNKVGRCTQNHRSSSRFQSPSQRRRLKTLK